MKRILCLTRRVNRLRKTLRPLSILWIVCMSLLWLPVPAAIWLLYDGIVNKFWEGTLQNIVWDAIAFAGAIVFTILLLPLTNKKIVLDETEIFVPCDKNKPVVQHETHVKYADIKNIHLVVRTTDSLNKTVGRVTPTPYIIYECYDNSQKAINVLYYSNRQTIRIIDESVARAKMIGNQLHVASGAEMLSRFYKLDKSLAFFKLREETLEKLEKTVAAQPGEKYSDYLTWEDFEEIVKRIRRLTFSFVYDDKRYTIGQMKKGTFCFWQEGGVEDKLVCNSEKKLFRNATVNGNHLKDVWNEITFA